MTNDNSTYYQNGHDLVEMKFNLSDVTLMGTENHINKMPEVINRLQVRLNEKQLKIDAYEHCIMKDRTCSTVLDDSPTKIYAGVHS